MGRRGRKRKEEIRELVTESSEQASPFSRLLCRVYVDDRIGAEGYASSFDEALTWVLGRMDTLLSESSDPVGIIFDYVLLGWRPIMMVRAEAGRPVRVPLCPSRWVGGGGR